MAAKLLPPVRQKSALRATLATTVSILITGCATQPSLLGPDFSAELPGGEILDPNAQAAATQAANAALLPELAMPSISDLGPSAVPRHHAPTHLPQHPMSQQHAASQPMPQAGQGALDIDVQRMPAEQFFVGLMQSSGENIVVQPGVSGSISLSLKNVSLEQVLQAVEDNYNISWERQPYGYRIAQQALQVHIFQVDYLNLQRQGHSQTRVSSGQVSERHNERREIDGEVRTRNDINGDTSGSNIKTESKTDLWADLELALVQLVGNKAGRTVTLSPQSGLVMVKAMPSELRAVASYLNQMQASLHRQVILEAKVLEVELRDEFQTGINWAALGKPGNGNQVLVGQTGGGSIFSNNGRSITQGNTGSLNPLGGILPDGTLSSAFGGVFSVAAQFTDFTAFIELLEAQGKVQVLSSPRVSTVNNQKAIIKVGSDEFFVTDISSTTITSGSSQSTTPNIELTPFFSGIALDVTPQISADNSITLHVHPTVSEVRDSLKKISLGSDEQSVPLAVSTIRESDSIVRARSGQVVVIGGLMQSSLDQKQAGVPWASKLPGIGNLFRHKARTATKKELVILLRPVVVEHGNWNDQLKPLRNRFQQFSQASAR